MELHLRGHTCVHAHDSHRALEITCPLEGVLRLRVRPTASQSSIRHPELPAKTSIAVVGDDSLPVSLRLDGDVVQIQGSGAALTLARGADPLGFSFADASGERRIHCTSIYGDVRVGYPVPHFRSSLLLRSPDDEAWLGFGEKVGPVDKRGLRFTFWNTDVLPHEPDTDPLYASIPFALSLRAGTAVGVFVDETSRSEVDIAQEHAEQVVWHVDGPELDLYLIAGPAPADVLRRYTALTGRMPLPPLWSLGAHQSRWGYESARDLLDVVAAYRQHALPLDAVHLDIDYMDGLRSWTWDRARFKDPRALMEDLRAHGVRAVTIVDPALKVDADYEVYEAARANDLLVRTDRGEVLTGEVWPNPCVFPDLTRPEVQAFWSQQHRSFLELGVGGIWNDMNEPSCFTVHREDKDLTPPTVARGVPDRIEGKTLPYDARHGDKRHLEVHNAYASGMAKASSDAFGQWAPERRAFVLTRAGFAGIQRHAAMWTGDNSSHWAHLELSLSMLQGLGMSGVPFCGADIPGFLGRPSGELLVRWMQAGVFYPLMRNHSARGVVPKEPWRFGEPYLTLAREALVRRYRLLPMLYTLMHEAAHSGLPPMRPLVLHAPGDAEALRWSDQFLFGPGLLVAPIVKPKQTRRVVYLPEGRWQPFFDLEPSGPIIEGPTFAIAHAPLGVTPMWLKEGHAVPLTGGAPHTATAWWDPLTWHIALGPRVDATLYEDDGDGFRPGRQTTLSGTFDGAALRLCRQVTGDGGGTRTSERLRLQGVPGGIRQIEGGQLVSQEIGTATLDWPGHAPQLVVHLDR